MKSKLTLRIVSFLLTVMMLIGTMPLQVLATTEENLNSSESTGSNDSFLSSLTDGSDSLDFPNTYREVATAEELEAALVENVDAICIVADFVIDRTFYVKSNTILYSETDITLTRSSDFAGDVFVVGQDSEDNLVSEPIIFSLGGYIETASGTITVNGNSENMTVDVVGSVIFVCPSVQVDLYEGITVTNCKKVGNERAHNAIYSHTKTENIGGAVAILSKDSLMNVYGGVYTNNSVDTSATMYGGAFYNYATMNVYGGLFEGNTATRAGAFYNYRSLFIYAAEIKNNVSTTAGGAIYLPASSAAKLYLGGNNDFTESAVLFEGNAAGTNGGAIYSSGRTSGQDVVFANNQATSGGAIYVSGDYSALNLSNATFRENAATDNGGAIYATGHNTLDIVNDVTLQGTTFTANTAKSGGAIALGNVSCANLKSCSFEENVATSYAGAIHMTGATLEIDSAEMIGNQASSAGALYLSSASTAIINKLDAQRNTVTNNGGTIYNTASTLTLYNSSVKDGAAKTGSAIYLAADATTSIYATNFIGNTCYEDNASNAAAVFVYTGGTPTLIHSCTFAHNTSSGLGGALVASNKSILHLYNVTAIENSAASGGFLYTTTTATSTTISGLTASGNTASNGGSLIWFNSAGAIVNFNYDNYVDLDVEGTLPADYWSTVIEKKSSVASIKLYACEDPIPPYTDYSGEVIEGLWSVVTVTSYEELVAAIAAGETRIKLVNDIKITSTLYVTASTMIFSTTSCTISRAEGFEGSMIVVGRDENGELSETPVSLELGLSTSGTKDMLVIDCGASDNAAIVVANGSAITLYDNVTVRDANGIDGSALTVEENAIANIVGGKFEDNVSTAGGVILNKGTLNVSGGFFSRNLADQGGILFNVGTLNIGGGSFTENEARLGGVIYNLGTLCILDGVISNNIAFEDGGAIYMANGMLTLSANLSENYALRGGAIYCVNGILFLEGASFSYNDAVEGGALYLTEADFEVKGGTFYQNTAVNGGAIFVNNTSLTLSNSSLSANVATNGGAIYADEATVTLDAVTAENNRATADGGAVYAKTSTVLGGGNTMHKNEADRGAAIFVTNGTLSSAHDTFEYGYAFEGGAIYADCTELTVSGSIFDTNGVDFNGGAIVLYNSVAYVNAATRFDNNVAGGNGGAIRAEDSKFTVYDTFFLSNKATMNGGALALERESEAKVYTSIFNQNDAQRNGGAIYVSDSDTVLTSQLCSFEENNAQSFGGAIYAGGKATANLYNLTATKNNATRGAVLYMTGSGTTVTANDVTVTQNTATNGTFVYGDGKDTVLYLNKDSYRDLENASLSAGDWEAALYGTLTVKNIRDQVPEFLEEGNEPAGDLSNAFDVSSAEELENALLAKRDRIRITADFEIDRTFYITYDVIIFSTARHTLTRAPEFTGDIFVVGEHADGTNSMLKKADARLTLGNPSSETTGLLIIDGNKDNMTEDVVGTVLFICNGSIANVYQNVSVINCYKVGNEKTYEEKYELSRPNRIGGSVAIIPFGTLNVYGGTFANNSIAKEDSSSEETRNSTLGGVFYSESNLRIYGGSFENNEGARGGIVYNYGTIKIYGGSFVGNRATVSGGVYYSPQNAAVHLHIGYNSTTPILFKNNTAQSHGGVIYASLLNGIVIYGNTTFEGNAAISGSGGAIYTNTTLTVMNTTFNGNTAKTRGGAVFATRNSDAQLTRFVHFENSSFIGNSSETGGAISLYAYSSDYESGAVATADGCHFVSNSAKYGGAICTERKSTFTIKNSTFDGNTASSEGGALYVIGESTLALQSSEIADGSATSHGGAISVRSSTLTITDSLLENNLSEGNGGAIYVSYSSSIDRNAKVTVTTSTFKGNAADNGGAIYATRRDIENDTKVLTLSGTNFANNSAKKCGGAILLTAGVQVAVKNMTFVSNSTTSTSDGEGGAIWVANATLEMDGGVFTKNTSGAQGGAMYLGTDAQVKLNNVTASRNSARTLGGFLYSTFADLTVYNSTLNNNSSNMGAGMYLYDGATSRIYNTKFSSNKTTANGAALFVYTYGGKTIVNGCTFERNDASGVGGGFYISGESDAEIYNITATANIAQTGGFLYETTSKTVVKLAGLTVSGNQATEGGNIVWGNTKNATLEIDKTKHVDLDVTGALDEAYWSEAIEGSLSVTEKTITIPKAETYKSATESVKNTVGKESSPVSEIFELAENSSDGFINNTYDKFPILDNSSNFMSRGTTVFDNINGGTVTVDTFVYPKYSTAHNMTVGEAIMIYQAMLYKKANPDEEVYIDISAYRFSVQTAVNINRDSRYFGYARALVNENYDEFGFVRVAYLLVCAAKMGIHVNVLGHRDGYPVTASKVIPSTFEEYFEKYINDYCDPAYVNGGTISDYLTFDYFDWTLSGGGKGGTDMMHTKLCAVSHYIDMNGETHRNAVWTSSSNLDGIQTSGYNANWKLQTATIISDHADIYQISVNYLRMMLEYADQEGIVDFQNRMNVDSTNQIDLILAGRGDEIPENERIVYIGTETDDVFEMYFTPFGGEILSWNEIYNPYCKYLRKLYESEDYIIFTWNAAEYSGAFPLAQQMEQMIIDSFHKNKNPNNKIYVNMESFDITTFDDLTVGVDIGYKSLNKWALGAVHNKDLQFSYVSDGQRYYVSLLNSLNLHSGSMYYQSNSALVIKETTCSENSVFSIVAKYSTDADLVTHTFTETERQEPTATEHGYVYKVCSCCGKKEIIETLHLGGEWIVQKLATPIENGIRYKSCVLCDKLLEAEETKYKGSSMATGSNVGVVFNKNTLIPIQTNVTPMTFEATVQLDMNVTGRGGVIVGNYSSAANENAINLEIFSEGRVRLFYVANGIRSDIVFNYDIRSSEPVHIAVTADGHTATLYVNGELAESVETNNPLPIIDKTFTIGGDGRTVGSYIFQGKIYSVNLFADVRTAEEIASDRNYVGSTAPDLIHSTYFTADNEPIYVIGNNKEGKTFKSTDALITLPKFTGAPATIEATILLPTDYTARAGTILGNYYDGTGDTLNLEVLAEGKLRLYQVIGGVKHSYTFNTDVRSNTPTHIALTIEGTTAKLYINGKFTEAMDVGAAPIAINDTFVVGGDNRVGNAQNFKGTIYSVSLFEDIRTEAEIVSDMLAIDPNAHGLLSYVQFTDAGVSYGAGQTFQGDLVGGAPCTLDATPATFEAVIQLSKTVTGRGGIIFSNNFKSKPIVSFEVFKNGKLRLYFVNGTTTVDTTFDTDVRSDSPIHIALTVEGTAATVYINGEAVETRTLALPLPVSPEGYHVGGDFRPNNTQYFKGTIYSVAMFDHARTPEQIRQDMLLVEKGEGLLFSTSYLNTQITSSADMHKEMSLVILTEATPETDGLGQLICTKCGKELQICSIPYEATTIISNKYTNTEAALKDGGYYVMENALKSPPKTFEVLLQLDPDFNDRGGVIIGNYDGKSNGQMNLEIYTNGNPRLWFKTKNVSYSYLFNVDVRSDEPVHLTFTIDGLSASLYVDGILADTVTLAAEVPFDGTRFCVANDNRLTAQVFKGEIYSASIFADVRTPEEIANDVIMITSNADGLLFSKYFVASESVQAKGPWADKSAVFVGDSITAGTNCDGETYWELLKEALELGSVTDMGIAGSCISSTSDYGLENSPLINRFDSIPEADLISIFMGTNDYGHDTPLGTIDDMEDVSFYGALNVILSALKVKYPNATIVFVTPLHRYGFGTNSATGETHTFDSVPNGAGHTLEDYVNAIKLACEKHGVAVVDLYCELDMDPSNDETREYYMPDGLHPNTAGHRQIANILTHSFEELKNSSVE